MAYIIAEPCINVKDKACVEVCPVDCIYEGETMLYIHPDECIDCGACEPVCPVKAIFAEDETPANWKQFIEMNKQFFKDNPGVKPATKGYPLLSRFVTSRGPGDGSPFFCARAMSTLPFARCSARVADALGPRQALHGRPRMCANCREWVDGTAVAIRHGHGRLAAPASARTE